MAKVSLRIYNREIESLIDQGHLDEAIAHCRHILKSFPKHLETYRLAGKAYLEAKRYEEAVDIFSRVMMAVPDDFVSHVGMSIIRDEQNKLDDAIWHMERAFESQPANAAIQSELQRLYGRRDGVEPPKIRMTRGALAHMYVQGELYPQAISEIRAVLAQDSQRSDMQVLLARAFFRAGQKADASDMCAQLLKRYPFCFDANRIMVELLPASERAESTQVYRHRVNELDPYAAFAKESVFRSSEVSDASVNLERLEYSGEEVQMAREWDTSLGIGLTSKAIAAEQPEWLKSGLEQMETAAPTAQSEPASAVQKESEIPDFLRAAGWTESSGKGEEASALEEPSGEGLTPANIPDWLKGQMPSEPEPVESKPAAPVGESPDWLSGLGGMQSEESAAPTAANVPDWLIGLETGQPAEASPASASAEAPDWLSGLDSGQPAQAPSERVSANLPDWLSGLDSSQPAEPAVSASGLDWLSGLAPKPTEEPESSAKGEIPDWLSGLGESEAAEPPPASAGQDLPDWLAGLDAGHVASAERKTVPSAQEESQPPAAEEKQPELVSAEPAKPAAPPPSIESLGASATEQDAAVAWLEMLAAKHGAKPEELVTDPSARSEKPPEWVEQARALAESKVSAEEPVPAAPAEDETGMWLRDLAESESSAATPVEEQPAVEGQMPDWLKELEPKPAEMEASPVQPISEEPLPEVPQWLSDTIRKGTTQPLSEEALTRQADFPEWLNGMQEETPEAEAPQQEVSQWLGSLEQETKPAEEPAPATAAEIPEWLSGLEASSVTGIEEKYEPHLAETEEPASVQVGASDLPEWLRGLDQPEPGERREIAQEDLPGWLQSEFKEEQEEEETLPEPSAPSDWHPIEPEAEPPVYPPAREFETRQPASKITSPLAEPIPTPPPPDVRKPAPKPAPAEKIAKPARTKKAVEPTPTIIAALSDAQNELNRGNIPTALAHYSKLIKKGRNLEETIRDLRDSLYRYPVEVGIWQALGDAYMRANRLQEALDAYNKAEELLR